MTVGNCAAGPGSHSAMDPNVTPPEGLKAGARGRAREISTDSAQFNAQSAAQSADTPGDDPGGSRAAWREWVTPPDIWAQDRPSLAKVWAYATHGGWARPAGFSRRAGQVYAIVVAFPIAACCKYIEWLSERGSRLAAAVVLLIVLAQFPPVSWLI